MRVAQQRRRRSRTRLLPMRTALSSRAQKVRHLFGTVGGRPRGRLLDHGACTACAAPSASRDTEATETTVMRLHLGVWLPEWANGPGQSRTRQRCNGTCRALALKPATAVAAAGSDHPDVGPCRVERPRRRLRGPAMIVDGSQTTDL
jgi:hypothetical protein